MIDELVAGVDQTDLSDLEEAALEEGAGDVAAFLKQIEEASENGVLPNDVEVYLPFYEEERLSAFTFGIAIGAVLERNYEEEIEETEDEVEPNVDPSDLPDEGGQQIEAEVEQSQSVRLDR